MGGAGSRSPWLVGLDLTLQHSLCLVGGQNQCEKQVWVPLRSCRTSCWRCQGVLWSPTGFLPPTIHFGFCLWLWVNRWGWVFPWSIFNPRLNLKRFQRSLQTIVSVTSKQILPLPPFVSPPLTPFILTQLEFEGLLVTSASRNILGSSLAPKQGSHPKSSCGGPGPPSFTLCVDSNIQEGQTDPGCCCQERKYLSFIPHLCVDSCCLLGPQGSM